MACWVTLDELKPLLDNIGGNGVHLEMDFHNEAEVEQAMRIVEEYRYRPAARRDDSDVMKLTSDNQDVFDADAEVERIIDKVESEAAGADAPSVLVIDEESPVAQGYGETCARA